MSYTKGEWKFSLHKDGRHFGHLEASLGGTQIRTIAVLCKYASTEENESNAKLITSAPELLRALSLMLVNFKKHQGESGAKNQAILKAESTIKKATS